MVLLLIPNGISIKEDLGKELNVSVSFNDKLTSLNNKLIITELRHDNNNSVDDPDININDDFLKNKDFIMRNEIKNAWITKNTNKLINDNKYDYYLIRNQKCHYIAVTKFKPLSIKPLSKHNANEFV